MYRTHAQRVAACAAHERFCQFARGRLLNRTTNAIIRHLLWAEEAPGDWVEILRTTPDDELRLWRNFGVKSVADVRRFIPYGRAGEAPHPWWLHSEGYQP